MFLYSQWALLSMQTRINLAKIFNIPKVGTTHVADNRIQNDGYLVADIEKALNPVAIKNYLGTDETDAVTLWHMLVDKVEGREIPIINVPTATKVTVERAPATAMFNAAKESGIIVEKKKKGRPFKKK